MAQSASYPVRTLEDRIVALEAVLAVCLADPKPSAVHKFRSEIRRIEAHLAVLAATPGVAPHKTQAARLMRHLHTLRHGAGETRDYDVHTQMLDAQLRSTSRSADAIEQQTGARRLAEHLAEKRARSAVEFQHTIQKREAKVARDLEALRKAVKPSHSLRMSATQVLDAASGYFTHALGKLKKKCDHAEKLPATLSDRRLHEIRKAAKTVRYMAEAAPPTQHATAFAKRFRAVQSAGGHWHDWLQIAAEAKALLGKKHPLTAKMVEARNRHRAGFLQSLQSVR